MDESFIMNRPTRLTLISGYRTSPCDMSKLRGWSEKGTGSSLCYLIDLLYIPSFRRECRSTKRSYKRTSTVESLALAFNRVIYTKVTGLCYYLVFHFSFAYSSYVSSSLKSLKTR